MAPRKKRTTRKKKPTRSPAAVVTLSALIVLGGAAVWASSQNKSPTESISQLVKKTANSFASAPASNSSNKPAGSTSTTRITQPQRTEKATTTAAVTVARPSQPLGSSVKVRPDSKPQSQVQPLVKPKLATNPTIPARNPQIKTANIAKPSTPALPPISQNSEPNSRNASGAYKRPKVIIARQSLQVRARAWTQADPVGKVEKGREMRSYAKVGKWHRVVVPATDIIGWVHEDQLIVKAEKRDNRADKRIITGSVAANTTKPAVRSNQSGNTNKSSSSSKTGLTKPVYPSRPVGGN